MENIYGYARVSTKDQNEDRQVEALKEFGVPEKNIFVDKKSGKDFDREQYKLVKMLLSRTENNVLVIKSIDRLGRNYKQIQEEWRVITQELKTDIVVLDIPLLDTRQYKDTLGTFIADLVLQVLSYNAEQDRTKIKKNQAEGIATAKRNGKKFGRPKIELPEGFEKEYSLWKAGEQTAKATMEKMGLRRGKFYMFVKDFEEVQYGKCNWNKSWNRC